MAKDPLLPTLGTFKRRIIRETQLRTRTLQPAKIVSYDDATSTATIELAHQLVERGKDGNTEIAREPFLIRNVPVIQLGGSDAYVRLPIAVGSTGLALVSDRSIAAWRTDGKAHPPPSPMLHNLGDCIFLAGVRADSNPLPPATMGGAVIEAQAIQLGVGATEAAILGNLFGTMWDALTSALKTHTHPVPGVTPGPGATTSSPSADLTAAINLIPAISTAQSAKVFIEP